MNITVTESAEIYLAELLEKQNVEGIAVRMFVTQPGTPYAETCLAYCRPDEVVEDAQQKDGGAARGDQADKHAVGHDVSPSP